MASNSPVGDLTFDHVRFFVGDLDAKVADLVEGYGFDIYATAGVPGRTEDFSVALGRNAIRLVLTMAQRDDHPAALYVLQHGDGVGDLAFGSTDVTADFIAATRNGGDPVAPPTEQNGVITASIAGPGDIRHTFVQRREGAGAHDLPGFVKAEGEPAPCPAGLTTIDHFAICVDAGQLAPTVKFYERVLGFRRTFSERIVVGAQAMDSEVVQSRSGRVTLTLIAPDVSREPGQIDEFLKNHGGAGVQHIAFAATDIVQAISTLRANHVEFLRTPDSYYLMLPKRLDLAAHSVDELRSLNVLADADHDGQLFQIFAKSVHPRRTFFFEVIERLGASTFGSGNIKALYQAVELERLA
jgi:4-hydroxymandelate synthase